MAMIQRLFADEEVIVRGERLSEIEFDLRRYVTEFVEEAAAQSRGRGFARWHRSSCVGVVGVLALARVMSSFAFGIRVYDPLTALRCQ